MDRYYTIKDAHRHLLNRRKSILSAPDSQKSTYKYQMRLAKLDMEIESLHTKKDKLAKCIRYIGARFIDVRCNRVVPTESKHECLETTVCGICLDTHKIKHMIETQCNHVFGRMCFGKYMVSMANRMCEITCPMCRETGILPFRKYRVA